MEQVLAELRALDDVVELAPEIGSLHPEISWGDHFFYFSPDGSVPANTQPFATIVTKDYPDDAESRLDPADRWRLNIHVGGARVSELVGDVALDRGAREFSESDVFLPHPVYGALGWIAVVIPAERTLATALDLLRIARDDERSRVERRAGTRGPA